MKIARADSSRSGAGRLSLATLPPAMLRTAASRLVWIGLACAGTAVAMHFIQKALQPDVALLQKQLAIQINLAAVIVVSLSLAAAGHFGWLAPAAMLRFGLVLEVVVGFALSTFDYLLPWDVQHPVRGVSWMVLWISVCGLLIPNRPAIMAAALFVTASMGPLAYLVYHPQPIPLNLLLIWNIPNYLVGLVTVLIGRRLYHLEAEVHHAKELGSYQLEALIGKGGMGEVWRAKHRMLARISAIKLIRPEMLVSVAGKDAKMIGRRFEQEAKVTAALRSPHTVELYDFGVSDDGGFYYVMELLEGIDLDTLVREFGPQSPARVAHIMRQVCQSLGEAHREGLVHRDIKPPNIFICRMGDYDFAKVLDFGLVKSIAPDGDAGLTKDGATAGTPAFMSPEAIQGTDHIDGRADIYGLGCVGYWLLTGSLVFEKKGAMAMMLAHAQEAPIPPSERTELPIPKELDRIILACLAKKPEDRPATAEALSRMLFACEGVGRWTQDDAEKWWQTNRPEAVAKRTTGALHETPAGPTVIVRH
ncbi:MAG: serine/threonine-protein kinase [Bryobacteraceae bacterium]